MMDEMRSSRQTHKIVFSVDKMLRYTTLPVASLISRSEQSRSISQNSVLQRIEHIGVSPQWEY